MCSNILIPNGLQSPAFSVAKILEKAGLNVFYGVNSDRVKHSAYERQNFIELPDIFSNEYTRDEINISIIKICLRYGINKIVPLHDAEIDYFSQEKSVFAEHFIDVRTSSNEANIKLRDKYESLQIAKAYGFPCPQTWSATEALNAKNSISFPVIVKPTNLAASRLIYIAKSYAEMSECIRKIQIIGLSAIVQEYIKGGKERSFYYFIDNKGDVKQILCFKKHRYLFPSHSTALECIDPPPEAAIGQNFLQAMDLQGWFVIQTIRDPTTGIHKFLEVNPRIGNNGRIWLRMYSATILHWIMKYQYKHDCTTLRSGDIVHSPIEDCLSILSFIKTPRNQRKFGAGKYIIKILRDVFLSKAFDDYTVSIFTNRKISYAYFRDVLIMYRERVRSGFDFNLVPWGDA